MEMYLTAVTKQTSRKIKPSAQNYLSSFQALGRMKRGDTPLLKQKSSPCLGKSELFL